MAQDWFDQIAAPVTAQPSAAPSSSAPGVIYGRPKPVDPYKARDQELQEGAFGLSQRDQTLQEDAARRAAAKDARDQLEWSATHNPDGTKKSAVDAAGKPLPAWASNPYEQQIGVLSGVAGGLNRFKDEYAGNTVTGGLENTIQGSFSSFGSEGQRDWWAQFGSTDNVIRNDLFGAALTDSEKAAYAATTVNPSMDPNEVRKNLKSRRDILSSALTRKTNFLKAQGYSKDAIEALAGEYAQELGAAVVAPDAPPPTAPDGGDKNKIASATRRADGMYEIVWGDGRKQVADSIPLAVNDGETPPESSPPGGEDLTRRLHMGVGDVAQAVGDTIGLVANPLNASINAVAGTDLGTDLGGAFREFTGAPSAETDQEKIVSAINRGGTSALAFGGVANLARGTQGAAAPVVNALLANPVADVAGGAGAGAGSEYARQSGAGTVGQVVGGILGGVGSGGAANALKGFANPSTPRIPNALLQAADRQNITMMPADVGKTGTRMAAGVTGKTLGGIPMAEGSQVALRSAKGARDRVAAEVGDVMDETGAGQAAQRGARAWMKTSDARAGQLFDRISVPGDADAVADSTRATLADTIKGFTSNPRLSAIWTGHPRLRKTLEALTPVDVSAEGRREFGVAQDALKAAKGEYDTLLNSVSDPRAVTAARARVDQAQATLEAAAAKANRPPEGGKVSWDDMKRLRSIVGEIVGSPSLASDGNATAALRRFYGALTTDMEATAQQAGPKALTEFRRANQYWRGRQGRVEDVLTSILGSDGGKGEAKAFEQINSWAQTKGGDFKRLAQAVRSLPAEEADTVRASLIGRMGTASPGRANADNLEFSPAEWATSWRKLSPRAKSVLFPGTRHREDLDDLSLVFDNMKSAGQYSNFSNTSLGGNAAAAIFTALGGPIGLSTAAGYSALSFSAGKLLSSPRLARWLASAPKSSNPQAHQQHLKQLAGIAARNPSIAEDVKVLQQQLMNVANDNVASTRSVAGEREREKDQ